VRELASLEGEPSPERIHVGISLALRRLLASLLGFPAPERTTTEIDRQLRRGPIEPATRRRVLDLLGRCDEVKFARRPATWEQARERLATARELGHDVARELVPAPAADGDGAGAA